TAREIEVRQSPEPLVAAMTMLFGAAHQLLERGHTFADGDSMGHDGPEAVAYLIRHMPAGVLGNDTDRWILVHPDSPFRHRKLLGRPKRRKTPLGLLGRINRGEDGWLRKRLAIFGRGTSEARQ
ncbi:MAG: hypothetical protein WBA67_15265, partial [Jannaschia sp.]